MVIPGYTFAMKTAISVPDKTFEQVEKRAAAMGISRSEFYTRAAQTYLEQLDTRSLTADINSALEVVSEDDSAQAAVAAGRRVLDDSDEEW